MSAAEEKTEEEESPSVPDLNRIADIINKVPSKEAQEELRAFAAYLQAQKGKIANTTDIMKTMLNSIKDNRDQITKGQKKDRFQAKPNIASRLGLKARPTSDTQLNNFQPKKECVFITNRKPGDEVNTNLSQTLPQKRVIKNPIEITDRTLSWCVLNPKSDKEECVLQFCFDVDEVREYIQKQCVDDATTLQDVGENCSATATKEEAAECKQCTMFGRAQIVAALKTRNLEQLIEIPTTMPDTFRQVIMNFEQISSFTDEIKRDPIADVVRQQLEKYLVKIATKGDAALTGSRFGTFWHYTKLAMTPFTYLAKKTWQLAWWVMNNPFYVMVITAAMRCIRIFICLYTSFPTLGDKMLNYIICTFSAKLEGDFRNTGWGVARLVLDFGKQCLVCLSTLATQTGLLGQANWLKVVEACIAGFGAGGLGNIANVMGQFLKSIFRGALDRLGLTAIADFGIQIFADPGLVLKVVWEFDFNAAKKYDINTVLSRFSILDFNLTAVLFVLNKIPPRILNRWIAVLVPAIAPPLIPHMLIWQAAVGDNPLVLLQWLVKQATTVGYAWKFVQELQEWIFDLVPCLFRFLVECVRDYFGFPVAGSEATLADGSKATATCCMTQIIRDLQVAAFGQGTASQTAKEAKVQYSKIKGFVLNSLGYNASSENTALAQQAVNEGVAMVPIPDALYGAHKLDPSTGLDIPLGAQEQFLPPETWLGSLASVAKTAAYGVGIATTSALAATGVYAGQVKKGFQDAYTMTFEDTDETVERLNKEQKEKEAAELHEGERGSNCWFTQMKDKARDYGAAAKFIATMSDERDKQKMFDEPVYILDVSPTQQVKFYLFTWKQNAVFFDGYVMHVSVMAQEVETQFPGCTFEFHGRKFVLLQCLPPNVANMIVRLGNPIVDLGQFLVK